MDRDRDKMAERILHLTLEILFRLTGEDYTVVKKTSSERCQDPVSEGWGRPLSRITGPPPHPLINQDINDQKILELTYKMIELLTGEVPIRCQDVTIFFSMEEWEYLEGHKDLYRDIMMEVPQPLTSPVLSSERATPERCPRPLFPQDSKQENPGVPQDDQAEDLTHINTTETYAMDDEWIKVEIPTDDCTDDCSSQSEAHLILQDFTAHDHNTTPGAYEEHVCVPDIAPAQHLLYDPFQQLSSSDSSHIKQNKNYRRDDEHQKAQTKKPYSCSECGKYFKVKNSLINHQRSHTGEMPFSCSECGKCFKEKSNLIHHLKIHTVEKPYSCSECGKFFSTKLSLDKHLRIHKGEKPFSCLECGKCFLVKDHLVTHQRTHTGEKPFSCQECGKCFAVRNQLVIHLRTHTGNKPYSCSVCKKCFAHKSNLVAHMRSHTGERPYSCSECEKCFVYKSNLVAHMRSHTGEKPFSCSECGKCFTRKPNFIAHQKIHKGI
ncbi:gastrula zinc finger protein XlCGF66.1-like [Anomaloglossus baeobatrachus]